MSTSDADGRMAELARDLRRETSSQDTLQSIVEAAVQMIDPCQSAGVTFATSGGRVTTAASTGTVPLRADELQQELREGPCLDAIWGQDLVSVPHLEGDGRWPAWAPRAVAELGVRSMTCLRLFTHDDRLGALNLFAPEDRAFTPEDLDEALAIAAHAAVAVAAAEKIEGLNLALDNRTVLGQATGLIMAQYAVSATQAFSLLRRLSMERNRKSVQVARDLVAAHHAEVAGP